MDEIDQNESEAILIEAVVEEPNSAKAKLLKDMKRTKGVRFNASKRIEETEAKSTRNTAYASVAVVVVTLLPVFFPLQVFIENSIALLTVALSIFILASSLLQSSKARLVKADQFQRCALEVNSLRRELIALGDAAEVYDFSNRYDEILRRYNINHDSVDYDRYRLDHPEEFPELDTKELDSAREHVRKSDRALTSVSKSIVIVAGALTGVAAASSIEIVGLLEPLIDSMRSAFSED